MIAASIMVFSAAVCVVASCVARAAVGICASVVMCAAMIDHAVTHWVSPVAWAAVLLCTGLVLATQLRTVHSYDLRDSNGNMGVRSGVSAHRVFSALTFPLMAWLVLKTDPRDRSAQTDLGIGLHTHTSSAGMIDTVVVGIAVGLAIALCATAVTALRRKSRLRTWDAGGMGVMLFAMALPLPLA